MDYVSKQKPTMMEQGLSNIIYQYNDITNASEAQLNRISMAIASSTNTTALNNNNNEPIMQNILQVHSTSTTSSSSSSPSTTCLPSTLSHVPSTSSPPLTGNIAPGDIPLMNPISSSMLGPGLTAPETPVVPDPLSTTTMPTTAADFMPVGSSQPQPMNSLSRHRAKEGEYNRDGQYHQESY
ncbi:hypothetical protein RMCBS344292_12288 [Rhizopus microsporus]|nr:hypothetical protein RMCBS344292_12288 [Rhizopus microsporus]